MALPVTTDQLYDLLEGDEALMDLLGVITYRDGSTLPALARLWPNEKPAAGSTCSGVEITISRVASGAGQGWYTGEVAVESTMRIYVTQHEAEVLNMEAVQARLMLLLEGAATITPIDLPDGLGGLAQVVIRYTTPDPVLVLVE